MPALLLPGEPVAVRLMNTIWADRASVHDDFDGGVESLRAWIGSVDGSSAAAVERGDVERFRRLRDALRRLAAYLTDDSREAAASPTREVKRAVAEVNAAVAAAPSWPQLELGDRGLERRQAGDAGGAARCLSSIAAQAIDLFTGPDQAELRACYGPGCVLYFVKDHPRREWCSAGCGNRARAARHYARHRAPRKDEQPPA